MKEIGNSGNNVLNNGESKLVEKTNIFESLELSRDEDDQFLNNILDRTEASTTDQPLINLSYESNNHEELLLFSVRSDAANRKEVLNLDIQSMIELGGGGGSSSHTSRFKDLKMTQI